MVVGKFGATCITVLSCTLDPSPIVNGASVLQIVAFYQMLQSFAIVTSPIITAPLATKTDESILGLNMVILLYCQCIAIIYQINKKVQSQ